MKSIVVMFLVFLISFEAFASNEFISGFEDIPLMEGLHEQEDSIVSFDSPDGRFIQVILKADDDVRSSGVRLFYKENLTALGWQETEGGCYKREDENLCLKIWDSQPLFISIELRSVIQ